MRAWAEGVRTRARRAGRECASRVRTQARVPQYVRERQHAAARRSMRTRHVTAATSAAAPLSHTSRS
eukprot:6207286-Pleurochrysis_carterae.AAC.5